MTTSIRSAMKPNSLSNNTESSPTKVRVREQGTMSDKNVILGLAFKSGLERVIVPFVGSGVPVEFEMIRALNTVSRRPARSLAFSKPSSIEWRVFPSDFPTDPQTAVHYRTIRQYEIVDIDPISVISPSQCDVMLAVQPSSLTPEQMVNLRMLSNRESRQRSLKILSQSPLTCLVLVSRSKPRRHVRWRTASSS